MPKSDWCRQNMDRIKEECYGGELSPETMKDAKLANEFTKRAPCLSMQSTLTVNKVRTIKDPKLQGKVVAMIEGALAKNADPRTGDRFRRKNSAFCITTPMVNWMIKYAETGIRPDYIKRALVPSEKAPTLDILAFLDELMKIKFDRRLGLYPVPTELIERAKELRGKIPCNQISQSESQKISQTV